MILAVLLVSGVVLVGVEESAQAAFPGKNGKIAFVRNNDIFTIDPATHRVKRLTDTLKKEYDPAWSSDGRWLAFGRDGDIYKIRGDGSDQVRLTQTQTLEAEPAWSPSGTRIVFSRSVPQKHGDLFTIRSGGSELQRLTNTPEIGESNPAWSPDGSKIAFVHRVGDPALGIDRDEDSIHVMNANGSRDHLVVNGVGIDTDLRTPDWSPDGSKLVFHLVQWDHYTWYDIFSVNADASGLELSDADHLVDNAAEPVFAPSGNKIIFRKSSFDENWGLRIVRADGSNVQKLTTGKRDLSPSWQPLP